MCGPETTNRPRGGALAALTPPSSAAAALSRLSRFSPLRGDLAFHTPGSPGSVNATHARLTLDAAHAKSPLSDLFIVIHGDLTRSAHDCGLFRQFSLPASVASRRDDDFVELSLDEPLSLQVGSDGIIGRRVSLFSGSSLGTVLAEGIVGFNFLRSAQESAAL